MDSLRALHVFLCYPGGRERERGNSEVTYVSDNVYMMVFTPLSDRVCPRVHSRLQMHICG